MAGLGIGPEDFALFAIADPDERAAALEARLAPRLRRIGDGIVDGVSRVAGTQLEVQPPRVSRRRGAPPGEIVLAFCPPDRSVQRAPHLGLAVSRENLHARVTARPTADPEGGIRRALAREAANLARKGKPFRRLRSFSDWDGEELPELAAAHSAAFWHELAAEMEPDGDGLDLGIAWTVEEARNLAVGDLLGAYRDLAPLFKLLWNNAG